MNCGLPGSSAHGILQARILEWVAISFSRGIFLTQGLNPGLSHCRWILYQLSHKRSPPIAKLRLKLKKVGKITRLFRKDLSQILYNYTVEITNRFKALDLIDSIPEELWTEFCDFVQRAVIKTIPKEKKCKKATWLSEEALQIAKKRREAKGKGEKERYTHLNAEFQRIARGDKKAFFSNQCKGIEEKNRMGKTTDFFKKIRDIKGTFHAKMAQ